MGITLRMEDVPGGYSSVPHGSNMMPPAVPSLSRGMKFVRGIACLLLALMVVLMIITFVNLVNNSRHETTETWLTERYRLWMAGEAQQLSRFSFRQVIDWGTAEPIVNSRKMLYETSGSGAIAIAKGWVEMVFPANGQDGRIAHNLSLVAPERANATAMEIVVTTFSAPDDDPRILPKYSLLLCGSSSSVSHSLPCTVQPGDIYTGTRLVSAPVIETYHLADDDLHTTFYLVIYCAANPMAPLATDDIQFVIELSK